MRRSSASQKPSTLNSTACMDVPAVCLVTNPDLPCPYHPWYYPYHPRYCPYHPKYCPYPPRYCPYHPRYCPYHPRCCPYNPRYCPYNPRYCPYHPRYSPYHPRYWPCPDPSLPHPDLGHPPDRRRRCASLLSCRPLWTLCLRPLRRQDLSGGSWAAKGQMYGQGRGEGQG